MPRAEDTTGPLPGDYELVWDMYTCPYCGDQAVMGLMSVVARSRCGAYYVQDYPHSRWWLPEAAQQY